MKRYERIGITITGPKEKLAEMEIKVACGVAILGIAYLYIIGAAIVTIIELF